MNSTSNIIRPWLAYVPLTIIGVVHLLGWMAILSDKMAFFRIFSSGEFLMAAGLLMLNTSERINSAKITRWNIGFKKPYRVIQKGKLRGLMLCMSILFGVIYGFAKRTYLTYDFEIAASTQEMVAYAIINILTGIFPIILFALIKSATEIRQGASQT